MTQFISKLILCGILCSMQIAFANENVKETPTTQKTLDSNKKAEQFRSQAFTYRYVKKNSKLAVEFYLKAAKLGDAESQLELGEIYLNDSEIPKDEKQAFNWIKKAADQGFVAAKLKLATMYHQGKIMNVL